MSSYTKLALIVRNSYTFEGKYIVYLSNNDSNVISIFDLSNGYIEKSVRLMTDDTIDGILAFDKKFLITYNAFGSFSYYDLVKDSNIASTKIKLAKNQVIVEAVTSRISDSLVIYACSSDSKIHGILVRSDSLIHATSVKMDIKVIKISPIASYTKIHPHNLLLTHPLKSIVFIQSQSGLIMAYSYQVWLQNVRNQSRSTSEDTTNGTDESLDDSSNHNVSQKASTSLFGGVKKRND